MVDSGLYMHDADKSALAALKAIPGFRPFVKAFMKVWSEQEFRLLNMSTKVRLGENQMAKYYDMLKPICEKLGIDVPELYVQLDVNPNSYTYGDTKPFIVITSGLFDVLPDELIPTVLAHECGHIACHHTLYKTMGRLIESGILAAVSGPLASMVTAPLEMAFAWWMRCSEFSADRAAVICDGCPDKMMEVCLRLAGFTKHIDQKINMQAFIDQAEEYKKMVSDSAWNKTMEFVIFNQIDHPLTALRALECQTWAKSSVYANIENYLSNASFHQIPVMHSSAYYHGKNYAEVQQELKQAGFSHIRCMKTSESPLFARANTICDISINEIHSFEEDIWFDKDAEIILTYYAVEKGLCLPEEYKRIRNEDSMEHFSDNAAIYQKDYPGYAVTLISEKDNHPAFTDVDSLIVHLHEHMPENQGIIEVKDGITKAGSKYIYDLLKQKRDRYTEYSLNMMISGHYIHAVCRSKGNSMRESILLPLLKKENNNILYDPYDSAYTRGLLMNASERSKYDKNFPDDPLTGIRKLTAWLISHN